MLQVSKTLNYLDSPLTVPWFSTFIGIWIYLRHYINLRILYATLTLFRTIGPYELNWETGQYKCDLSQWITFCLLLSLQSINLFWLFFILRISFNIAFRSRVVDVRSGDEDSGDEKGRQPMADHLESKHRTKENGKAIAGTKLLNGNPVAPEYSDARTKEGESYADAIRQEKKMR